MLDAETITGSAAASPAIPPAPSPAAATPATPATPATIVQLIDTLYVGGSERQILEQLRIYDRTRWRPLVASLHAEGEMIEMLRRLDVPHTAFPLHTGLEHPNTAVQIARMARWLRAHDVRLVHAQDFYSNLIAVAACKLVGVPVVASRLDLSNMLTRAQRIALRVACRLADRVVVNAEELGRRVVRDEGVPADRVRVVHNGIDVAHFLAESRRDPDPALPELPPGVLRLTVVANMHLPDKGQADLLEALARLGPRARAVQLMLVGDGVERPRLQARVRRLGLDDVHFLGRRRDVPAILARSDALCLPSWAEGLPNAVMEGMAAGLPVIATRVGGCPELIDDGVSGLLVAPRDPRGLARAVARLLDDREAARRMGEHARERIGARFSMDATVARFTAMYREVIAERSARSRRR